MISLPQIQFACDLCRKRVEVEIEFAYVTSSYDGGHKRAGIIFRSGPNR